MMRWRVSPGPGRASILPKPNPDCPERRWGPAPPTGGKNGSKRHVLVDGHGVPLSLVVTGAQRHEVTQGDTVREAVGLERPQGTRETPMRLYADKGYLG